MTRLHRFATLLMNTLSYEEKEIRWSWATTSTTNYNWKGCHVCFHANVTSGIVIISGFQGKSTTTPKLKASLNIYSPVLTPHMGIQILINKLARKNHHSSSPQVSFSKKCSQRDENGTCCKFSIFLYQTIIEDNVRIKTIFPVTQMPHW